MNRLQYSSQCSSGQTAAGEAAPLDTSRISARSAVEVSLYRRDCRVHRVWGEGNGPVTGGGPRGVIRGYSKAAARRFRFAMRNVDVDWWGHVVLTYGEDFPCDGRKVKRDLKLFCDSLRRRGVKYAGVLEFQGRGAPHVHLLVTAPPARFEGDWTSFLRGRWFAVVGSGDELHRRHGCFVRVLEDETARARAVSYLVGYFGKGRQKEVPAGYESVGRFWFMSRGLVSVVASVGGALADLASVVRVLRRKQEANLRGWFAGRWTLGHRWRPRPGRGFVVQGGAVVGALWGLREGVAWASG